MDKLNIEDLKKCNKSFLDSYIFSLYLSKVNKCNFFFCLLFSIGEDTYLITKDKEVYNNFMNKNINNLLFVKDSIQTNKSIIIEKGKKREPFIEYSYCEQMLKIINGYKREIEFKELLLMYEMVQNYKPLLVCITKDYEKLFLNQVKDKTVEGNFSIPVYMMKIKELQIFLNIYELNSWDIFSKFNLENVFKYNYKIPNVCISNDCIYINKKE